MTELVTFGETMLRLTPPQGQRLARVDDLSVNVGGAESNVAVAAANLGTEAAWASVLPDTDLGERVVHALRGEGVEPAVTWTDGGRVGTYYFERGGAPRGENVMYDRAGTPVRDATPEDLPGERIRDADVVFTTGITPALSDRLRETTRETLVTAGDAGATTAFDLNYRAKLWDRETARAALTDLLPAVDVMFVAERDARAVLDRAGTPEAVGRELTADFGLETVVLTRGDDGALAVDDGEVFRQDSYVTDTVDPVGSGDAFAGGFLARRLDDGSVPEALAYGAATAAVKRTVAGDMSLTSAEEVAAVVEDGPEAGVER